MSTQQKIIQLQQHFGLDKKHDEIHEERDGLGDRERSESKSFGFEISHLYIK